jgi:hypothetical protein
VIISNPDELDANASGTGILCSNECNGSAQVNPIGGTAPYDVLWTPFSPAIDSTEITGLCSGDYLATVTDDNGCIDTMTYTVNSLLVLDATLDSTNVTCSGNSNGTVTANITGGTLPYSISWVGPCVPTITDTNFIDNLCPGSYTVTINDFNGCSVQRSITIEEPLALTDSTVIVPANCGVNDGSICLYPQGGVPPYDHSWSNGEATNCINGLGAGFYTDTVTDFNGCIALFTIGVSNPNGPSGVAASVNDATCFGDCNGSINVIVIGGTPEFDYNWIGPNGFTGSDSTETGLCSGLYSLTVTDSNDCILATNLVIGESDSITENALFTNTSCSGVCDGSANITPTGGVAPYDYLWSNNETGASVSDLCAGTLQVTITDFLGCQKIVPFTIESSATLTVSSNLTNPSCSSSCDASIEVNPSGGTLPYVYQWTDPNSQTSQTATNLCDGEFIVSVMDFNDCFVSDTILIVGSHTYFGKYCHYPIFLWKCRWICKRLSVIRRNRNSLLFMDRCAR